MYFKTCSSLNSDEKLLFLFIKMPQIVSNFLGHVQFEWVFYLINQVFTSAILILNLEKFLLQCLMQLL